MGEAAAAKEGDDDGRDFSEYRVDNFVFQVSKRYELKNALGKGAFGIVCSAEDTLAGTQVAIKKLQSCFRQVDNARKLVREIRLLRHFSGHPNIVGLTDLLKPQEANYDSVYLVMELMDTDLGALLKKSAQANDLTAEHLQYFMYQMLCGLRAIHCANVMHRDLKPANIFVSKDCSLKIGDFGLARDDEHSLKSEYVVTRWYRAPELLMNWDKYSKPVDAWSMGCIFAELLSKGHRVLFQGRDFLNQLHLILDVIGTPSEGDYEAIGSKSAQDYLRRYPAKEPQDLSRLTLGRPERYFSDKADDNAFDLLRRLLAFNPAKRITIEEALHHPYLGDYSWDDAAEEEEEEEEEEEDLERKPWPEFDNCFEVYLTKKEGDQMQDVLDRCRRVINQEICSKHPEFRQVAGVCLPPADAVPTDTRRRVRSDSGAYDGVREDEKGDMSLPSQQTLTLLDAMRVCPDSGPVTGTIRDDLKSSIHFALGLGGERDAIAQVLGLPGGVPWTRDGALGDAVRGEEVKETLHRLEQALEERGLRARFPASGD